VLARPGADSALVAQAISVFGNVTVLERPVRVATLVSTVRFALRARQKQYQIRAHLAELDTSAAALREADKRKDEFIAVLAHELRNPLAPIRTSLEIMKRTKDKEIEEEAKAVIERQTNQLVTLVDDLLDVARIRQGRIKLNKERVDLREVVEMALESTRPLIEERGHDLQVSLPLQKIDLEVDKTRLAQVLLNLLNNAAKYTESGGKITLSAELEKSHVVIGVKDTGLGIPAEKLPHVFELFTRLERDVSREGLGIGLSIVKRLVEMHGGSIAAYSAGLNQGSEFTLRLPFVETLSEAARVPARVPTKGDEEQREGRCVLIIDDYELNRKTIASLLRLMGHDVMTASSGEEGLEALKNFRAELILLDLNMPGMNGFETARRIRELPELQSVMLVALTGYGQDEDIRRTKEAGFDGHLVKPVEVKVLEALLNPGV
jgi:signal transduction histidine kinase/CheY-like chemotaxis protein